MLTIRKTAVLLSAVYLLLLFGSIVTSRFLWFYPKEIAAATQLQQAELYSFSGILNKQKHQLQATTHDYAKWDISHEFAAGINRDFAQDNFTYETFSTLELISGVVISLQGELIAAVYMDYDKGAFHHQAPEFSDWLQQQFDQGDMPSLLNGPGFHYLNDHLYLISVAEITNSAMSESPNGYLMYAREVDSQFWEEIRNITRISFHEQRITGKDACPGLDEPITAPSIQHSRCLSDNQGNPAIRITFYSASGKIPELIPLEIYFAFIAIAIVPMLLHSLFLRLVTEPIRRASAHMESSDTISPLPPLNMLAGFKVKEIENLEHNFNHLIERVRDQQFELTKLSQTDKLTGIGNRRAFEQTLNQTWRRAIRHQDNIALILLDIDYFKRYNDRYGHQQGDIALRKVAQAIESCVQRQDEGVFRYGGEEFIAVFYPRDANELYHIREKLKVAIEELKIPHEDSEVSDYLTLSSGIAWIIDSGDWLLKTNQQEWIRAADAALYEAKAAGRNCNMLQIISPEISFTGTPVLDQSQPKP